MKTDLIRGIRSTMLAGLLIFVPAVAGAAQGNKAEAVRDAAETRDDIHDINKDRRDRAQIVAIAASWNAAVDAGDRAGEHAADARLRAWIVDELHEANVEVREATREKRASARERNRSRNEARRTPVGAGKADDVHDLRDDRRDLRDDRRDQADAVADRARLHAKVQELKALQPRFEAGTASAADYASKRVLLASLVREANQELRDERQELREDNRERREDRRERREDARRGN